MPSDKNFLRKPACLHPCLKEHCADTHAVIPRPHKSVPRPHSAGFHRSMVTNAAYSATAPPPSRPYSPVDGRPCSKPDVPPQRRAPRFSFAAAPRVASAPSGVSGWTPMWASPESATSAPSALASAAHGAPPVIRERLSCVADTPPSRASAACAGAPAASPPPIRPTLTPSRQRQHTHVSKDEAWI